MGESGWGIRQTSDNKKIYELSLNGEGGDGRRDRKRKGEEGGENRGVVGSWGESAGKGGERKWES